MTDLTHLESVIEAAWEARAEVSAATRGEVRDAVDTGLALLDANIWLIAACIGFTTFALATLGLLVGKAAGARLGKIVELVGGVALIALGLKILLEHLGVLAG